MRNTLATLVSTLAAVGLAQTALAASLSPAELAAELRAPDNPADAPLHATHATEAGAANNWYVEVALAEKAYREDPTVQNEFNLATGYQHTGRATLAIPLYQDVAARGQYMQSRAVYNYEAAPNVPGRVIDSTLGMEAQRRLDMIAGKPAPFNP